jgi:RNA polymerase sigma factor (sigma-70 family)
MSTTAPARVGDETTLFAELHPKLARQVRPLVRTSEENVQDACSFAFLQLLRYQPSREGVFPWLLTVAVREAVKLDRRGRRDRRLPARDDGVELEPVDQRADPNDLWLETLAALEALEAIAAAGLTARQARIVALHAAGHTYESISEMLGLSVRTVERQLLRARRKLRFALAEQGGENAFLPGSYC